MDFSALKVKVVEESESSGTFEVGPLPRGYGHTVGNPLRRVLLSSLPGSAVTGVKVSGVRHEYSTIKGVEEDVLEISLRVKQLKVISHSENPQVLRVSAKSVGELKASDIEVTSEVEIINKDLVLANITDKGAKLDMEITVEQGVGYVLADEDKRSEAGVIPLDANFCPVERVKVDIESTRVGKETDLDLLRLTVETGGRVRPSEAISSSSEILKDLFGKVAVFGASDGEEESLEQEASVSSEMSDWGIEDLDLPARIARSLLDAGVNKVGDLMEKTASDITDIPGLGAKALEDLVEILDKKGINLKE